MFYSSLSSFLKSTGCILQKEILDASFRLGQFETADDVEGLAPSLLDGWSILKLKRLQNRVLGPKDILTTPSPTSYHYL